MTGGAKAPRATTLQAVIGLARPTETVVIEELGVELTLHALSGAERIALAEQNEDYDPTKAAQRLNVELAIIAATLDSTVEEVGQLPTAVIDALAPVALRLTGITRPKRSAPNADNGSDGADSQDDQQSSS